MSNKNKTKCAGCRKFFTKSVFFNGKQYCETCYNKRINNMYIYVNTGELVKHIETLIDEDLCAKFNYDVFDILANKKIENLYIADNSNTKELSEIVNQQSELIIQMIMFQMINRQKIRMLNEALMETTEFGKLSGILGEVMKEDNNNEKKQDMKKENKIMFG